MSKQGPVASCVATTASFVTLCQDCCSSPVSGLPPVLSPTQSMCPRGLPKHRAEHVSLGANGQILHRDSHPTLGSCFWPTSLLSTHCIPYHCKTLCVLAQSPFCCCLCLEHIYDELHNCGLLCGVFLILKDPEVSVFRRLPTASLPSPGSCYLC